MSYVKQLSGPEEDIEDIVWSPQGKVCMAVSVDRTAWLWKVESDDFKALLGHKARLIHGFFTKIQRPSTDKEMIAAVTSKKMDDFRPSFFSIRGWVRADLGSSDLESNWFGSHRRWFLLRK